MAPAQEERQIQGGRMFSVLMPIVLANSRVCVGTKLTSQNMGLHALMWVTSGVTHFWLWWDYLHVAFCKLNPPETAKNILIIGTWLLKATGPCCGGPWTFTSVYLGNLLTTWNRNRVRILERNQLALADVGVLVCL